MMDLVTMFVEFWMMQEPESRHTKVHSSLRVLHPMGRRNLCQSVELIIVQVYTRCASSHVCCEGAGPPDYPYMAAHV